MNPTILGLHHVTAITADGQKNIDFYCGVLGLRLVKLTVNFDDPTSYHLYYGDALGRPGTIMTFFAWPGAGRGRVGPPQATATSFAVPRDALPYWVERLNERRIPHKLSAPRFGEEVLTLDDPDGMTIELIATATEGPVSAASGSIPADYAILGFHSVTLSEEGYETTAKLLTDVMSFRAEGHEANRFRYRALSGGFAAAVDLLCVPAARHGALGAGIVHHIAFRTPDDEEQHEWRGLLARLDYNVSPVMDREYFHSIYFREPGGVLFEIATDPPGFTVDEPLERLGSRLKLPPQYEPHRQELERLLPPLRLPEWGGE